MISKTITRLILSVGIVVGGATSAEAPDAFDSDTAASISFGGPSSVVGQLEADREPSTLGIIENIIRAFAGRDFVPTRVLLASRARDLRFDPESAYRGVPVITDQPYGAIEFPRALLCSTRTPVGAAGRSVVTAGANAPPQTLSEALAACIEPYLLDGYPHIALAAEIAGCSLRKLQRRLAEEGTTYTKVIDEVRCRVALSQLRDNEVSLGELSRRLGYSEQSAFTRAFRGWTGTSPGEYRTRVNRTA